MRTNVNNLVTHLINKNGFEMFFEMNNTRDAFIDYVTVTLCAGDVSRMGPAKLGEIMCGFNLGVLNVDTPEVFKGITYEGDSDAMFRHLVSRCLALAIYDLLRQKYDTMSTAGYLSTVNFAFPLEEYQQPRFPNNEIMLLDFGSDGGDRTVVLNFPGENGHSVYDTRSVR